MTILEIIQTACKSSGVPEQYAERIQKTFKIEKAEGIETFVNLFKDNILPAIEDAGKVAKEAAEKAAVAAYEEKYKLKEGKPIEVKDEPVKKTPEGMNPEVKEYLDNLTKKFDDLSKKYDDSVSKTQLDSKKEAAKQKVKEAGLPDKWADRINVESETSVEDQIKTLSEEFTTIRQSAIDDAVKKGDYTPSTSHFAERSEEEWAKLMDGDNTTENNDPGVVDLGI